MTPEEWGRVKELFDAALERNPEHRTAFLDEACSRSESAVRLEVEALIAAHDTSENFLESPAAVIDRAAAGSRGAVRQGQLIGRYRVHSLLGSGGMGDVYLAEDLRLERKVALKLLPEDLSSDQDRLRRFEQEARTASALSHPNVCVVYEIAETEIAGDARDIRRFIAMEYVAGESLRDLIEHHNKATTRIPLGDTIRIVQQIAAGLRAAHEAGVVHRDIKPDNVIVRPDGLVKVLDFGLAKLTERKSPPQPTGAERDNRSVHTGSGMILGTVKYMSPEQTRGLPVDARTDIWSLGAVLYELVTGRPAFSGPTSSDIIVAVLDRQPSPLPADIPMELTAIVNKALEKDRDRRYQTIGEMSNDLTHVQQRFLTGSIPRNGRPHLRWTRRTIVAVLAVICIIGSGALLAMRRAQSRSVGELRAASATVPAPLRLAVLPFENLGRPEDAYFVDGVADELRGKLASFPGVEVIARSSSNQYRASKKPPEQIARELGVRYLLVATVQWDKKTRHEGGVDSRSSPDRVRVLPELVDARPGGVASVPLTKWQQHFDATLAEVFDVQADIAQQVAEALKVSLQLSDRSQAIARPTNNLAAYDAFLHGEEASNQMSAADPATLRRAARFYEGAIAADTTFALALARLVEARAFLFFNSTDRSVDTTRVRLAAERAVALAPHRPDGHRALGYYYLVVEHTPSRAAEQFRLARLIAPNDAELLLGAAWADQVLGHWSDAILHLRRAAVLDPRSEFVAWTLGQAELWTRQYPNSRATLDRALALAPTNITALQLRCMVDLAEGNLPGARATLRRASKQIVPADLVAFFGAYWELGWVLEDAQQRLLLSLEPAAFDSSRAVWALTLAQQHAWRGDMKRARELADVAHREFTIKLRASPNDGELWVLDGLMLAYLSRRAEAISEGERGAALVPARLDARSAAYMRHELARIYVLVGEPEKAIDQLEHLLTIPYFLSPGWLRIDPNFVPLRGNPRFKQLTNKQ
jgi:serine/threonine protein kinase/TolB-like protein/Flp pilus assembly protein TadD